MSDMAIFHQLMRSELPTNHGLGRSWYSKIQSVGANVLGNRGRPLIVGSNELEHYQRWQYGFVKTQAFGSSGRACYEDAAHSIRRARTGSIDAARHAGMMPEMVAASTRTPMATAMAGTFTLVIS